MAERLCESPSNTKKAKFLRCDKKDQIPNQLAF